MNEWVNKYYIKTFTTYTLITAYTQWMLVKGDLFHSDLRWWTKLVDTIAGKYVRNASITYNSLFQWIHMMFLFESHGFFIKLWPTADTHQRIKLEWMHWYLVQEIKLVHLYHHSHSMVYYCSWKGHDIVSLTAWRSKVWPLIMYAHTFMSVFEPISNRATM